MPARVILCILYIATCVYADETYAIRIARPLKVGDQFDVSAKVALDDSILTIIDGKEMEDNKTVAACRLTGSLKIDAVTSKGQAMDLRLKLKTIECVSDGQPAHFFKAGDELRMRRGKPENVMEVNGKPAEELQSEVIESILSVQDEGEVLDDDVFGTSEKMKVGDQWPINAKAAIADLEAEGLTGLKPEHIKGNTRLVGKTEVGNKPALVVRTDSQVGGKGIGVPNLPETMKTTRFFAEITGEMELPVDPQSTDGRSKALAKVEVDAAGKVEEDGVEMVFELKIRRRVATDLTAVAVKQGD